LILCRQLTKETTIGDLALAAVAADAEDVHRDNSLREGCVDVHIAPQNGCTWESN
jgi:hypothetical protein